MNSEHLQDPAQIIKSLRAELKREKQYRKDLADSKGERTRMNHSETSYMGQCPSCCKQWRAQLLIKGAQGERPMPPPVITLICQCELPVTQFEVIYQGTINTSPHATK